MIEKKKQEILNEIFEEESETCFKLEYNFYIRKEGKKKDSHTLSHKKFGIAPLFPSHFTVNFIISKLYMRTNISGY